MPLLLQCTRFCLMLDSFPKALYNSDMKATKQEIQEIQAIKTCLKDPTKANTKQKSNSKLGSLFQTIQHTDFRLKIILEC